MIITGLRVYTHNVGRDKIVIDLDIVYAGKLALFLVPTRIKTLRFIGDAEFTVQTCGFKGGLNQLVVRESLAFQLY